MRANGLRKAVSLRRLIPRRMAISCPREKPIEASGHRPSGQSVWCEIRARNELIRWKSWNRGSQKRLRKPAFLVMGGSVRDAEVNALGLLTSVLRFGDKLGTVLAT